MHRRPSLPQSGHQQLDHGGGSRWGKQGIRANAVAPGLVLTENNLKTMPQQVKDFALKGVRSTRLGAPADIGAMVTMLLSDDAAWVNGQVISVDGGTTLR